MSDLGFISCAVKVDDPQETALIVDAYAVLVEAHLNFELKALIGVFKIWRSKSAYQAGKQAMLLISTPVKPEEGGKEFFSKYGIDGVSCQMGPSILDWCITYSPELANLVPVKPQPLDGLSA